MNHNDTASIALSLEYRLLTACCIGPTTLHEDIAAIIASASAQIDWVKFLLLVDRHRVGGGVFHALQGFGAEIPRDVVQSLALSSLIIRRQNAVAAAETAALQLAFNKAQIPARFFKGAALAQQVYGSLDYKHSKDIDVLVAPDHARAAAVLLERRGYRLWSPAPYLNDRQWSVLLQADREVAMVQPSSGLQVEPHWRLAYNPRLLSRLDTTSPVEHIVLPGYGPVETFVREDHFAYLCTHGTEHGWIRLKWLADVNALLRGLSPAQVEAYFRHAEQLGVAVSAAVTLALCESMFGFVIPDSLHGEVRRNWGLRALERYALRALTDTSDKQRMRNYLPHRLLMAWMHGCLGMQLRLAFASIHDALTLPLPRALHFLYPLLRLPLGLVRRVSRSTEMPPYPAADAPIPISATTPPST